MAERNVWALMEACIRVQANGPALLAASIKTPEVLAQLVAVGAAAVTLPPASLAAWCTDALTQTAVQQFDHDIQASLKIPETLNAAVRTCALSRAGSKRGFADSRLPAILLGCR